MTNVGALALVVAPILVGLLTNLVLDELWNREAQLADKEKAKEKSKSKRSYDDAVDDSIPVEHVVVSSKASRPVKPHRPTPARPADDLVDANAGTFEVPDNFQLAEFSGRHDH